MRTDVVIIGNGLIGGMAAKFLRDVKGMEVVIVDDKNVMGASKCSFGIWKEGWVNSVIKKEYEDGLDLLDAFCGGVQEMEFIVKPKPYKHTSLVEKYKISESNKTEIFKRVDCSLLLNETALHAKLESIDKNRVNILYPDTKKQEVIVAKHIIIAAGVWTTDILIENGLMDNLPYIDRQWGSTFKLKGNSGITLPASQMREWSPYKQSVFVNFGNNTGVFGDGSTVKNPKDADNRLSVASDRMLINMNDLLKRDFVNGEQKYSTTQYSTCIIDILEGYRPYLSKKSTARSFVNKHSDHVYSATGGAKNSTVLAGHMAKSLYRLMKG